MKNKLNIELETRWKEGTPERSTSLSIDGELVGTYVWRMPGDEPSYSSSTAAQCAEWVGAHVLKLLRERQ